MLRSMFRLGLLAGVALLSACATSGSAGRGTGLPLAPQSSRLFQCGPTTLAAVLAFHGKPIREEAISQAIYSPTAHGVLVTDLAWYARAQGFQTVVATGTMDDLRQALAARQPPIVLLDLGAGGIHIPHFTAITGWTEAGVLFQGTTPGGGVHDDGQISKTMATRWKTVPLGLALTLMLGLGLSGCATLRHRPMTDPLTPAEHLALGVSYEHDGSLDLALREYARAAVGPEASSALTAQGNVHFTRQQMPEAEDCFRRALALSPDNTAALNNLAWLLARQQRSLEEAERLIRHALALGAEPRASFDHTLEFILQARSAAPLSGL